MGTIERAPEQNVRLTASLPGWVRGFRYVRNHHFIELEDKHGNKVKLHALSLIRGVCLSCGGEVFVKARLGAMTCPHCVIGAVEWVWGEAQLSFVPEAEASFITEDLAPKDPTKDPT